jgi:hypothetical protein
MAVSSLPVAMIELSFRASLVPVVGAAALSAPGFRAADVAAVTLSPVTVSADPEDCVASDSRTNALTKDHLAMPIHVRRQAGLDNGDRSWQVRTSVWLPDEGCQTERPDRSNGPGTRCVPAFDEELYQWQR